MVNDPIDAMKKLLDNMRPGAENAALLAGINQALADIVDILEKPREHHAPDFSALVSAIQGIKLGQPAAAPAWKTLRIDAPVDVAGRPTGQMTITRVE